MTVPSDPARAGYIPTLDGWRAIAVTGVIVYHLTAAIPFRRTFLGGALDYGKYGVELFFAISGYLITTRLYDELRASGRVSLSRFYLRRAFRILPPALLFVGLAGVRVLAGTFVPSRDEWMGVLFFFRNYVSDGHRLTEHLWSLAVEEHFYVFWPALFLLRSVRARPWVVPVLAIGVAVWRVLVLEDHIPASLMSAGSTVFRTDVRLDALLWGASLAIAQRNARLNAVIRRTVTPFVCTLAIAAFLTADAMRTVLGMTVQAISAPLIVVGTSLRPEWRASRWLEWAPLRWVGRLSYGLYLYQQMFLPYTANFAYAGLLIVPVACASYYAVERPIVRLGRDLAAGRWARRTIARASFGGLAVGAAIVVWWMAASSVPRPTIPACRVALYDEPERGGHPANLRPGIYDLTRTPGVANDTITSLQTGARTRLRACDDLVEGHGGGRCHVFHPGSAVDFLGALNDRISYLEVTCE